MSAPPPPDARAQLVARLLRGEGKDMIRPPKAIPRRPEDAPVPLSPAQRQVWLHAAMAPDVPLYNESITIHRLGDFDLAAMEASVNALLRRHEAWRASFRFDGTEPVQIIHPDVTVALALEDVSHLPASRRDAAAVAIATADARAAIDLARAPLLRARVVRLGPREHRLYLTLHHIIFDGVSIYRVILPELAALYDAFAHGLLPALPPALVGYGDFAAWAAAPRDAPELDRQRRHWRAALAKLPPKLELPADRARPASPSHAGSMEVFTIPLALTEALKALARANGATLYMALLAGFTAMLHLYTGAEDVIVGGVTDLRRRPELERVVGYFLNTLPLRARVVADMPFADHLAHVRETVLSALAASEVPFDEIVRTVDARAAPGAHPLFDILFSVEPPVDPFPPGWDLTQMDVTVGAAKFDLYLELDERPDGMIGRFLYGTERFDAGTIRRMIGHLLVLLEAAAADPACRLGDLPLLTAAERAALTRPPVSMRPPPRGTVPERIAARARATPDAVAVTCGGERWSYAALDGAADRVAARLRARDLGAGSLVAVALGRSPTLVAALVGVMRAGAAYLPLDPRQPAARLRQIVADAGPHALLTERALDGLVEAGGAVMLVDDDDAADARPMTPAPPTFDDLAYVLYTSGSTGRPKGVEIGHGALANLLASMAETPGFAAADRLLAVTTVSFDIAALELFLPLVTGGELVLASEEETRDPLRLAALIAETGPSVVQATPATWAALLDTAWPGDPALRIWCGGESLSRALADRLLARAGAVWNLYGPTETCIWSTVARVGPGNDAVPIGGPIANTALHVLDAAGRPVPPGLVGELFIGGMGLARGYRRRPDLTAERFAPAPFGGGERLYRTGDRVRVRSDGQLLHLGRVDAEEKIRGFRVAVEEVEGMLAAHDGVSAAAVRAWADEADARSLAAYVVPRDEAAAPPREVLRAWLAERLPDYMVPSTFTPLPSLPLTASGKIDRQALPPPLRARDEEAFAPPATESEHRLAAIWRDLLGLERIGRDDSFFDLGGHSLLVARLLVRVSAEWGRPIGMPALFRARRLRDMAALLDGSRDIGATGIPIQPRGWRPPFLWVEPGPSFVRLGERIGLDQPLVGVPLEPIPAADGSARDFREHARDLVDAIRRVQPQGPYYLGGWCVAGILTLEAAAQLEAVGEEVRLLVLGDAFNPVVRPPTDGGRLLPRLRFHGAQLLGGGARGRAAYLRERAERLMVRLGLRAPAPHWSRDAARALLDTAVAGYRPGPLAAPTLLFQSRDPFVDARIADGWHPVLQGPVTYRQMEGTHDTLMFEPHLDAVAKLLRDALTAAQSGTARPGDR